MKCQGCGEEYDGTLFPVCPYCLLENDAEALTAEETNNEYISKDNLNKPKETKACCDSLNKLGDENNKPSTKHENKSNASNLNDNIKENNAVDNRYLIKSVFYQNKFNFFVRYCSSKSIVYVDELNDFDFNLLYNMQGITKKQAEDVINHYQNFCNNYGILYQSKTLIAEEMLTGSCDSSISIQQTECKKNPAENADRLLISEAFFQNKFNLFVNYCTENNLMYVDDLENFNFYHLYYVKGMGTKKIEDIMKRYQAIKDGTPEISDSIIMSKERDCQLEIDFFDSFDDDEKCFLIINEQLKSINIDFLSNFKIKHSTIDRLKMYDFYSIGSLENVSKEKLRKVVGNNEFASFIALENLLNKSFVELFATVLIKYSETDKYNCALFKANGFTLQEIADLIGVTRERVRQLIKAFHKIINPFMITIVHNLLREKNYITSQELLDIYDNDDFDAILLNWCKNNDFLNYFDEAGVFLLADISVDNLKDGLLQFAEELIGNGKKISDCYNEIDEYMENNDLKYIDIDVFINFLLQNGYKRSGDFITKGRHSYAYICARVIAEKFPKGIKIHEGNELAQLRKYIADEYGDIGLPEDDRTLSTRLLDYTILCGRGKVIAEENIDIDNYLLEEIKDYIDSSQEAEMYYSELYARFEGLISMMSNIDNYHFLHGVLKLYFPEEYSYGRDYLTKKGNNYISGKFSDRLRNYIIENNRPVSKAEILKNFSGISEAVIWNTVVSDDNIIQWEYNSFYLLDYIQVTEKVKCNLQSILETLLQANKGYCSEKLFYKTVKQEIPEFIAEKGINKPEILFFICAKIFKDEFTFKRPHISYNELLNDMTTKTIALYLMDYPAELYYNEYRNMTEIFGWPEVTSSMIFSEIEQDYIRVSADGYLKKEIFSITEESLDYVQQVIQNQMDTGYISLMNCEFIDVLPVINYEWNVFLLRSIIDVFLPRFRVITTNVKDRRYERGIVVEDSSDMIKYEDVVARLMRVNDISSIHESKMLTLLIMNNLTYKVIPRELYEATGIRYDNGNFIIVE